MDYEMVLCVINAGHSQDVMDAARKAGAKGGTLIKAHGTAKMDAENHFNIPIQSEKEIVMIIVEKAVKDAVLRAVYESSGLDTEIQGIAFSMPVDKAVGLKK